METWNQRLAQAVADSGRTPNSIAVELKIAAPTLAAWIGAANIKPAQDINANNLFRVCALLGVRPEWVLYRRGPKREGTPLTAVPANTEAGGYPNVESGKHDVKLLNIPATEEMKQEITTALGTEELTEAVLLAVCLMIRAGLQAPARGDQHHTKRVTRKHGRTGGRKSAGSG